MTASVDSANASGPSIILIEAETADVSSTAIRQRCGEGGPLLGLVPASVEQHIEQHGLYRLPTQDQPEHRAMTKAAAGRLHGQS
jgi:nicotinic acid mononucleotide adenylyltransferase